MNHYYDYYYYYYYYYYKCSLILRVIQPPHHQRKKGETLVCLSSILFHYPSPEGKGRDHSLPILHTASERPRAPSPKCSLIIWVFHYPTPEVKRRDPGHPLSLIQPHF